MLFRVYSSFSCITCETQSDPAPPIALLTYLDRLFPSRIIGLLWVTAYKFIKTYHRKPVIPEAHTSESLTSLNSGRDVSFSLEPISLSVKIATRRLSIGTLKMKCSNQPARNPNDARTKTMHETKVGHRSERD